MEQPQWPVPASEDVLDHALRAAAELMAAALGDDASPVERARLAMDTRRATETVVYLLLVKALAHGSPVSEVTAMAGCTEHQLTAFLEHYPSHVECIAAGTAGECPAVGFLR